MSNTVIKVENISKQYRLGEVGTGTISHDLNRWWAKMRGKEDPFLKIGETNDRTTSKGSSDYVWALKDINFDIQQGDAVGIIGRNGAGKSTLLKILSKTTTPTTGSIKIKGRIASLLEVGTGFHPEMTGRENIFLNGAILGMRKKEIARKFDEIVDFAGVERYIDTPVKRYSSGMYVRLAFAVAAHLESEILIVDEVLAVGDAEFQKKCLGKMGEVSKGEGRTVLFVSHNMAAVKSLCNRTILLENGLLKSEGDTERIVLEYLKGNTGITNYRIINTKDESGRFLLKEVGVKAKGKDYTDAIIESDTIEIFISYQNNIYDSKNIAFTLAFKGEEGDYIIATSSSHVKNIIQIGEGSVVMKIPPYFFQYNRTFFFDVLLVINSKDVPIWEYDAVNFHINPEPKPMGSWMGKSRAQIKGVFDWVSIP